MLLLRLILLIFLLLPSSLWAVDIKFQKALGLEQLPNQTVWAMAKDTQGFIWLGNNAGLFRYDGYNIEPINAIIRSTDIGAVRAIAADNKGSLWVGTKGNGLFQIKDGQMKRVNVNRSKNNQDADFVTVILPDDNGLWFATYNNLNFIDANNTMTSHKLPDSDGSQIKVTAVIKISAQQLLLTTSNAVFVFDVTSGQFSQQDLNGITDTYITSAFQDNEGNIWVATSLGVFVKPHSSSGFKPYQQDLINYQVNSIVIDDKSIWFGTVLQGLVKISKKTDAISYYKHDINNQGSIPGDSIMTMLLDDDSGILFTSSFYGGVSYFDTNTLNFGKQSQNSNSLYCAGSSIFYGIDIDYSGVIWLSTQTGLIEYNPNNGLCINHNLDIHNNLIFNKHIPKYSFQDAAGTRWIVTTNGINKLDLKTGKIDPLSNNNLEKNINFMIELSADKYLLGTNNGLYLYHNQSFELIKMSGTQSEKTAIYAISKQTDKGYYLATSNGLALYDKDENFIVVENIQSQLPEKRAAALVVADNGDLWLATHSSGLFRFDKNHTLISNYSEQHGILKNIRFKSIIQDQHFIWLSTDNGLIRLNTKTNEFHIFHANDGLQDEFFFSNSVSKSPDGKLYFGGRNGLNAFYSDEIRIHTKVPKVALTQFNRFGQAVLAHFENTEFKLEQPINELDSLTLSHKDYIVGFKFAVLDYADTTRNQYAYKMEGLDPDWNHVNADNRFASYTNLKAGDYVFKVKGSNKDGIWNETGKQLKIKVYPAPWLSWWAYTLYALSFFLLLFGYLYRKNKANAKITLMLRDEVQRQTLELQSQKLKVETLLDKKNELFANVSHEFRTPLTLILGPINKLLKSPLGSEDVQSLRMVNRNANRLLTMIEQILQLAKLTDEKNISFIPQQVHSQIEVIVESFKVLAENKNITLTINHNKDAAINATQDCMEIILGNLLSNAIKYTQPGGEVTVNSQVHNEAVTISVSDTGCGLNEQQKTDIFNRFERLDIHHDIAGIGIGLSLVEEIVKVNNGHISVNSQPGQGSTFAVTFACIDLNTAAIRDNNKLLIDQMIKDTVLDELNQGDIQTFIGNKNNPNLLIIDDNQDMREHIADSLKSHYYCMLAPRGKAGIALAIKHIPEIIICDVMMPEMDGFQVSRILRSDSRTSHIPLILLTALNDKKSRIKGWRENIDVYLTKPFDAQELLLQIENIRVIRNILKKQANAAIQSGKVSMNSGLAKLDQKFLDKFIGIIEEMYDNPHFLRPQMAKMMAVSERQLQRKIKGLIDRNPLDLLREYRLKKAGEILKDGYQVSVTADKCGFNSVTYFSKCFKQQYGITPKEYQSTCQNQP